MLRAFLATVFCSPRGPLLLFLFFFYFGVKLQDSWLSNVVSPPCDPSEFVDTDGLLIGSAHAHVGVRECEAPLPSVVNYGMRAGVPCVVGKRGLSSIVVVFAQTFITSRIFNLEEMSTKGFWVPQ